MEYLLTAWQTASAAGSGSEECAQGGLIRLLPSLPARSGRASPAILEPRFPEQALKRRRWGMEPGDRDQFSPEDKRRIVVLYLAGRKVPEIVWDLRRCRPARTAATASRRGRRHGASADADRRARR